MFPLFTKPQPFHFSLDYYQYKAHKKMFNTVIPK